MMRSRLSALAVRCLGGLLAVLVLGGCAYFTPPQMTVEAVGGQSSGALLLGDNSSGELRVTNSGGQTLVWKSEIRQSWIQLTPASGSLGSGQSETVLVSVNRTGFQLDPGSYLGSVTIQEVVGRQQHPDTGEIVDTIGTSALVDVGFQVDENPTADACDGGGLLRAAAPHPPAPRLAAAGPAWVPGQLIVKYHPHAIDQVRLQLAGALDRQGGPHPVPSVEHLSRLLARSQQLEPLATAGTPHTLVVAIPPQRDPQEAARELMADPRVAYAEPNLRLFRQAQPNDPLLPQQWPACRFGLPDAWGVQDGAILGGADAPKGIVAVLDSGVDIDHPDLQDKLLPGLDVCPVTYPGSCAADRFDDDPSSSDPHGTHVAGIAAAQGDNLAGIAGVAFDGVRILPVKVFNDTDAFGNSSTDVPVVDRAIRWAVGLPVPGLPDNPNPARIVNLSLGGQGVSQTLNEAVAAARATGALVFAAAGNSPDGTPFDGIFTPANAPDAVAVGAVNSNFQRSGFSLYDATGGRSVQLMAPGGYDLSGRAVLSTVPGGDYGYEAGTSMAAPFVAGVAALLWSEQPHLSADEVMARLEATAFREATWHEEEYGSGVVCADAALGLATRCGR